MTEKTYRFDRFRCAIIIAALLTATGAQAFTKKGTTVADFLKIGVGGRPVAMAGSVVACPDGLDALYWNPAGMVGSDKRLFGGTHSRWIASINHDFIGLSIPISRNWSVGGYAISLSTQDMEQTTVTQPEGTGVKFGYSELALGGAAGVRLTDRFRIGGAVKVVHTTAFNESATAFALDVGTHLVTTLHGLSIGMALANFGTNMKLDGSDLIVAGDPEPTFPGNQEQEARLETNEYPLPVIFRIGLAMDVVGTKPSPVFSQDHRLTAALAGDHYAENVEQLHAGVEYAFREMLFLRGGYTVNDDSRQWAAGAGVALHGHSLGIRADFAYESMGVFDMVPRFSLALEF